MGVLRIIGILGGLFALLNWLILPRLRLSVTRPMPDHPIPLLMCFLLARVLRGVCLIGTLTYGAIALTIGVILLVGRSLTSWQLEPIYLALVRIREKLETLDASWALLTIGVLSVGLWLSVRRDARRHLKAAFEGAVAQAVAEVQAEAKAGTTLTPTPEMVLVSNKLEQLGGQLEQAIAAREPKVAGSPPDASTEPELAALIIQFQQLEQGLHQLDVRRRLDIGGQLAGISAPVAQSESRFGRLLISVGLINSMGRVSRVLTTASLVLLAPTLLTISGSVLADALDQANIAIHDLVVADSEAQAERDWQTSMPPPPQPRELTQDDTTVIHLLSLHYQHYARAHTAREFHVTAESSAVRRRVLDDFAADHLTRLEVHGGPGEHPADPGAAMSTVGREPFGEEARRAQEILESHARNTSEREWAAFREKAEAFLHSFGQPLSTGDLGQRLFTEILNTGGSIAFDGGPEFIRAAQHYR